MANEMTPVKEELEATVKTEDNLDIEAVYAFLRKKGLRSTEDLLRKEAGLGSGTSLNNSSGVGSSTVDSKANVQGDSSVLSSYKSEGKSRSLYSENDITCPTKTNIFILIGDPSLYSAVYSDLSRFIESSLDVYRHELSLILYPVFVHMYLELVYNGHETAAKDFIATFGPRQESFYQEDIKKLSYITKREHMRGSELMENFRTSQFTVRMSRDSKRFYILNCQIDTAK